MLTCESGGGVVFACTGQDEVGFVDCECAAGVTQGITLAVECGTADGVIACVGGVLRSTTVANAAESGTGVPVDQARDHAQTIATRKGQCVVGFAGVIEAHIEGGGFAVNSEGTAAQGGGVVGGELVAVVSVVA